MPPRWARDGVGDPTDIDDERCILFCTRLTVNITGDLSETFGKKYFIKNGVLDKNK